MADFSTRQLGERWDAAGGRYDGVNHQHQYEVAREQTADGLNGS